MVSTRDLIVSTTHVAKSTSGHSADCDSGPWSACSSTDMCTPMPHVTSHPISSKRYSHASNRSLASATQMSAASSDIESTDYHASNFGHPTTPPTLSATEPSVSSGLLHYEPQSTHAMYPAAQSWTSGRNLVPTSTQLSDTDGSHFSSSDHPFLYHPFTNWRPQPIGSTPLDSYYPNKASLGHAVGDHSRSDSYNSTASSVDSCASQNPRDVSSVFSRFGNKVSLPQMSWHNLNASALPGTGMFSTSRAANMKHNNLMAPYASEALKLHSASQDARSLLDSLTPLPSVCSNPQVGFGNASFIDPQALFAHNAALGASPLLYLYGLNPDVLAAQNSAFYQLANAASSSQLPTFLASSVVDNGGLSPANKKTNLYKTELCRSWEEKGTCRYGSKCQFAHGQEELKNVSRHPKFKTEVCRTFWLHGSCPYGKRCCFLHTTATATGAPPVADAHANKQASKADQSSHDPPTSRLQKRVSNNPLSLATSQQIQNAASGSLGSPQPHTAFAACSLSNASHSRSNSNSSCSLSSDGSSHIDSLRIQIWPRFGARDQVPPQDAPGPRSRLQRLRPTEDYSDSTNSLPSTSTLSTTRLSPFGDRQQPPHSAFSDIPLILARSPSQHISKARSATNAKEPQWPMSRLPSSTSSKEGR